jgi:fumarylacetoacetase
MEHHGRASSIAASGHSFHRPRGQTLRAGSSQPDFGPTQRLDYELELGAWMAYGNSLGGSVPMSEAQQHIFGLTLLNDWSVRDIQAWEYHLLGPFLFKNFANIISF